MEIKIDGLEEDMKREEMERFAEEMTEKMTFVFKILSPKVKKKLHQLEIGLHHMKVLLLLSKFDTPPTISRISRNISISLAMMTRIIDRLEERGLVSRKNDPKDRRVIRIVMTPRGEQVSLELKKLKKREMILLLKKFEEKDRKEFMKSMRKMVNILYKYKEEGK
jgi:DNA-binding MarR family transcriptional regulator